MERKDMSPRDQMLLTCLSCLPQKIVAMHDAENITEFVLHELCGKQCFNLTKAAYFIDNPDFDCFKGITGFSQRDCSIGDKEKWESPEQFSDYMKNCSFNNKVRSINRPSTKKTGLKPQKMVSELASQLDFANPIMHTWPLKHDNSGVLLFERGDNDPIDEHLGNGLCLLAFCPVY